jgi:hypothetical protein
MNLERLYHHLWLTQHFLCSRIHWLSYRHLLSLDLPSVNCRLCSVVVWNVNQSRKAKILYSSHLFHRDDDGVHFLENQESSSFIHVSLLRLLFHVRVWSIKGCAKTHSFSDSFGSLFSWCTIRIIDSDCKAESESVSWTCLRNPLDSFGDSDGKSLLLCVKWRRRRGASGKGGHSWIELNVFWNRRRKWRKMIMITRMEITVYLIQWTVSLEFVLLCSSCVLLCMNLRETRHLFVTLTL